MDKLLYRDNSYFDDKSLYVFKDHKTFKSKVEYSKGYWWTTKSLKFKATTLPCYKVS